MKKHHTFLLSFALTMLLGTGYLYFSQGSSSEASTPAFAESSLSTTSGMVTNPMSNPMGTNPLTPISSTNSNITSDTAFLTSLISLTSIKIDTTLLSSPSFRALHDNNVRIDPVAAGRPNPFAPISSTASDTTNTPVLPVVTEDATQITDKTAILNGTLSSALTSTASYFEYGPTDAFGKTTPNAVQSLVNTFVVKVSGLTPKTTYYYRAAAKVNGTILYGAVNTFTTN